MRTTRPSTSFFALVCTVALVGGSVGEPFNLVGCTHHEGLMPGGVVESPSHGGGPEMASPGGAEADAPGDRHEDEHSHGPCVCIGACAGAGLVGVAIAGAQAIIVTPGANRPEPGRAAVPSAPAGRTPYLLPYPTAPPRLG